ncbi:hypothetical protein Tco_0681116 [Tanacetum coccineum]|uniref:Uncharacterized protein n=1 Tax=Tanacetum coccineum TaxID=301880 RepID=A0ABQ4XP21_9ASTR
MNRAGGGRVGRVVKVEVDQRCEGNGNDDGKPVWMAQNKLFAIQRAEIVDLNNEEHTLGLTVEQFQKWLRTH